VVHDIFNTIIAVFPLSDTYDYQFTWKKQKARGNSEVHRSLKNCESSAQNAHITLTVTRIWKCLLKFVDPWSCLYFHMTSLLQFICNHVSLSVQQQSLKKHTQKKPSTVCHILLRCNGYITNSWSPQPQLWKQDHHIMVTMLSEEWHPSISIPLLLCTTEKQSYLHIQWQSVIHIPLFCVCLTLVAMQYVCVQHYKPYL
jgi:hypothetical protein